MNKIKNIAGITVLSKSNQKNVFGGDLTNHREGCGCIIRGRGGQLEIIVVDCNNVCPDGSTPISGLGH